MSWPVMDEGFKRADPPVVEPKRSIQHSPQAGYRVRPIDRMADARARRKRSGREQPFIGSITELKTLAKSKPRIRDAGEPDEQDVAARRTWLAWLKKAGSDLKRAERDGWGKSKFSAGKGTKALMKDLKVYCRGQVPVPATEAVKTPFDSMFEVAYPAPAMGKSPQGLRYTTQPVSTHGVGTSPSAAPIPGAPHDNVVDGPVIRKNKRGKKRKMVGAGSMVK